MWRAWRESGKPEKRKNSETEKKHGDSPNYARIWANTHALAPRGNARFSLIINQK
jgi:hypothetical protein